ncbi:nicotinate (nicotinamide) nucleotide adenylyltransferase [Pseudodesulfovibrio mercurii]|uniref:Probable nicotinate-nucleotide adenylyltransferase n=1 Tax=Pseudodesulfovibrio mercurii TaxID=641491 RepID=F0JKQ3_9BACT|nr:nicotinate (nicotinamide) nucleotide adenylyltransferase [Pseudodesulfovibrio mercurii]EGB16502.1 nicotinate (nicotinamide) nucleotide adenylyltransferase [Pseudodesulfovibrio mercurii]
MKRGILGGSFNPVHTGHVRMAVEVLEQLGLDRVELVPASEPPHKRGGDMLPFELRLELVRRALEGIAGLGANSLEAERSGPSFTCDTLTCYRTEGPADELFFILGASTFLELHTWRRGLEIPALASLVVVNRWEAADDVAGFVTEHWPEAEPETALTDVGRWRLPGGNTIRLLDTPRLDIKGGHIRRRWRDHRNLSLLVPDGVRDLLEERADEIALHWGARRGA